MRISAFIALASTMVMLGGTTTASAQGQLRVVLNGKTLKVDSFGYLEPDCTSIGSTSVRLVSPPEHGKVQIKAGRDFPRFGRDNIRAHCNTKRAPATLIFYTPSPGYTGPDSFQVEAVFPNGTTNTGTYRLDVR